MKTLKNIVLLSTLVFSAFTFPKENSSFKYTENKQFQKEYILVDFDGDNLPDALFIKYDLNKNNKIDSIGMYLTRISENNSLQIKNDAVGLYIDKNEDGKMDYGLEDSDLDGTLDKHINKKTLEKIFNQSSEKQIEI